MYIHDLVLFTCDRKGDQHLDDEGCRCIYRGSQDICHGTTDCTSKHGIWCWEECSGKIDQRISDVYISAIYTKWNMENISSCHTDQCCKKSC